MYEMQRLMIGADQQVRYDAFVGAESARLLRIAYLLVGDRGHAEDMLQTALLNTARHWRTARTEPGAYARRAVVNLAKDHWRTLSRRPKETALTIDPSVTSSSDFEERDALLRACRQLPAGQRATLVLRFFEDLGVEETAAVLRCSPGTVKSQTHRALANLRELLTSHNPETAHVHR